jgi:hypothetical protein
MQSKRSGSKSPPHSRGEEISITRRGVPVARLVAGALECLRQLRADLVLEGDLKGLARDGLA